MDVSLLLFEFAVFSAVAGVVFALGRLALSRNRLGQRLPVDAPINSAPTQPASDGIVAFVAERFTEGRFGIGGALRQKIRLALVRAGYFDHNAIRVYVFVRLCTIVVLPIFVLGMFIFVVRNFTSLEVVALVAITLVVGVLGPDAYLSRRQSRHVEEYRRNFPDLLDLLTVCVTAGLTIEASFDRIRDQLTKRSRALARNIELMGVEMRAGRSSVDALTSFADRLGVDEAASFVAVLRHSIELGGDVAATLREFSEEMRVRRMLVAEKRANELPVKIVIPLALGIFPVILMIVLLPVVMKLLRLMSP
jgi:tight adherence protein C